jgi:hypothetical protein
VPRVAHVLWSPQSGPICAYDDPSLAWEHAGTMLGVQVSSVEVRDELPEIVRGGAAGDDDEDDTEPISVEDIDDAGDDE